MGSEASKSRRSFLSAVVAAGSAVIGAVLAKPGAAYVIDPLLRSTGQKGRWVRVAKLDSLSEDPGRGAGHRRAGRCLDAPGQGAARHGLAAQEGRQGRGAERRVPAPRLQGRLLKDQKRFGCPCHDSAFAEDGERIGGPAPRGMDPLETRVDGRFRRGALHPLSRPDQGAHRDRLKPSLERDPCSRKSETGSTSAPAIASSSRTRSTSRSRAARAGRTCSAAVLLDDLHRAGRHRRAADDRRTRRGDTTRGPASTTSSTKCSRRLARARPAPLRRAGDGRRARRCTCCRSRSPARTRSRAR